MLKAPFFILMLKSKDKEQVVIKCANYTLKFYAFLTTSSSLCTIDPYLPKWFNIMLLELQ